MANTSQASKNSEVRTAGPMPSMGREDWNKRYEAAELIWTANANEFLKIESADLPRGRAIDLAAGECRNSVWLAEDGWKVRAVDFSDVGLEKGKKLAAAHSVLEKIEFVQADLRVYDAGALCFDLVAMIYLQIPQEELVPIIQRAAMAVAPGGTFLLVAHDSLNLEHGFGGPQRPDVLYTAEQVVAVLDGELEIEKAQRVERIVTTPDGVKVALDCLVRAKRL